MADGAGMGGNARQSGSTQIPGGMFRVGADHRNNAAGHSDVVIIRTAHQG